MSNARKKELLREYKETAQRAGVFSVTCGEQRWTGADALHQRCEIGIRLDPESELAHPPVGECAVEYLGQDEYRKDDGGLIRVPHADTVRTTSARGQIAKPPRNQADFRRIVPGQP